MKRAIVTLDAYPDDPINGYVTRIDLLGQNAQGVVAFPVRIDLGPIGTAVPVRPLMTAAVDVVVAEQERCLADQQARHPPRPRRQVC